MLRSSKTSDSIKEQRESTHLLLLSELRHLKSYNSSLNIKVSGSKDKRRVCLLGRRVCLCVCVCVGKWVSGWLDVGGGCIEYFNEYFNEYYERMNE